MKGDLIMKYQVFSDSEWIYPDTPLGEAGVADLISARGADVCFQLLTNVEACEGEPFAASFSATDLYATVLQLLPAHVGENSSAKEFTTTDYESVKHFVTRRAPFEVYDVTAPIQNGRLFGGRAAFFVRIDIPANAAVGERRETLTLTVGDRILTVPVTLRVCKTQIPPLSEARFHMVHWIYYHRIAERHGVAPGSREYYEVLAAYLQNELDMRTDYLMLPSGEPVRDADGRVVDFDFSHAEQVGKLALSMGFRYVMGGFSVRWRLWSEAEVDLLWERTTPATSIEGYRQLKLYFSRAWETVTRNRWQDVYYQCIEDEPQFANSMEYRAICGICRRMMPGVRIHDPVESTELGGAVDVWVVKQAVYEKYIEEYRALQEMGEEMWIYTCGFPAGKMMNHVLDLPITATRLPIWMCFRYGATGFLHWGYHLHNPEGAGETCYDVGRDGLRYPAGNSFVVYPAERGPMDSLRSHAQRSGAYDYELLTLLAERDRDAAMRLVERVCRTFDDYAPDAETFDATRRELLELLG
ncbi:MAG: DUF4091 domain-containing protein [Ruminococcaceae bacterium]|nr:DUF4091 domain-containing protein [Oscillospiraceae bacterium]